MNIQNLTPFATTSAVLPDGRGAEHVVVIIKGTWKIGADNALSIADEQMPVQYAPVYRGDPKASSMLYESDLVLDKPGTDCVLIGHAYAPAAGATQTDVTFAVGPVRKTVRVYGNRIWIRYGKKMLCPPAAPFERIPLIYENAFGGKDASHKDPAVHESCAENPVGKGFLARHTALDPDRMELPNLEDPHMPYDNPMSRPRPAGFGAIPPFWQPRLAYAGTYDEKWRRDISPLPPPDIDRRFHCSAASGLSSITHLAGTEEVLVENGSPHGRLSFFLPGFRPEVTLKMGAEIIEMPIMLDTVIVEPDEARLQMAWRAAKNIQGRIHEVNWLRVKGA